MRVAIAAGLTALTGAALASLTPAVITPVERTAARAIRPERLKADIRFLSSDLLEGRGPSTRGDELGRAYIAARFESLGLEPGAPGGSWSQPFEMVGITSTAPGTIRFVRGGDGVDLRLSEDYIAYAGAAQSESRLDAAEVVFVGYGIVAPEYQWDDFKGADLKGKVLLMMNNDPEDDPALFAGKTRLYYGRWGYKYDMARAGWRGRRHPHPHDAVRRLQVAGGADLLGRRAVQPARGERRSRASGQGLGHRGGLPAHRPARGPGSGRAPRGRAEARLPARAPRGEPRAWCSGTTSRRSRPPT